LEDGKREEKIGYREKREKRGEVKKIWEKRSNK
jgi:hypothetical protein